MQKGGILVSRIPDIFFQESGHFLVKTMSQLPYSAGKNLTFLKANEIFRIKQIEIIPWTVICPDNRQSGQSSVPTIVRLDDCPPEQSSVRTINHLGNRTNNLGLRDSAATFYFRPNNHSIRHKIWNFRSLKILNCRAPWRLKEGKDGY